MKRYYIEYLQPMKLFRHDNNTHYFQDLSKTLNISLDLVKGAFRWGKGNGYITFKDNTTYFKEVVEWQDLIDNLMAIPYPQPKIPKFYEMFEKKKRKS